ncbi:MAG: EamA family transporter [Tannerella sp.]|jgi:undecaprenyl phosphate-alpha-L-ara4N flippase subunit ArnE|nr:EamA family transporter [Tannerella sp.]
MWKLIILSVTQCLFLCGGQVFLKFAMARTGAFAWTWAFFRNLFINWQLLASGLCMAAASGLWFYMIKRYELSVVYPMISISYVFGMLAAIYIFHETVPISRWIGVFLIMMGVIFIAK